MPVDLCGVSLRFVDDVYLVKSAKEHLICRIDITSGALDGTATTNAPAARWRYCRPLFGTFRGARSTPAAGFAHARSAPERRQEPQSTRTWYPSEGMGIDE